MTETVRSAIDGGDVAGLATLVSVDPHLADEVIRWGPGGKNPSCPLQYVCDMKFKGRFDGTRARELADVLIEAGADIDHRHEIHGDTPLIGAASLAAEAVALRLIEAGADVRLRGLHQATALHWAAMLGMDRLVGALIDAGAAVDVSDGEYRASPLRWALQGWVEPPKGDQGRQVECVARLTAAGARVEADWLDSPRIREDPRMLAALHGRRPDSWG